MIHMESLLKLDYINKNILVWLGLHQYFLLEIKIFIIRSLQYKYK